MITSESSLPPRSARPSGLLERTLTRWLMRAAQVSAVTGLSAHFRLIDLEGETLRNCAWTPGQKVQIKLDGSLLTRTYTPIDWDEARGATRILAYTHGAGPGSDWVRTLSRGSACHLFGPRRSMDLENLPRTVVLVGDETSFGLAAAMQTRLGGNHEVLPVFEVTCLAESKPILDSLGIDADVFERRPNDDHLFAMAHTIESFTSNLTHFILSGNAQSIQFVSRTLRKNGIPPRRVRTKAYWAPGKTGLD